MRYHIDSRGETREFAVVVSDAWPRKGIGRRLMSALLVNAKRQGFIEMNGTFLAKNTPMRAFCRILGFVERPTNDGSVVEVSKSIP